MIEQTYLKLQNSEGIVCQMASRLLAAQIAAGQLNSQNEDELIGRSLAMAIKLAQRADRMIDSDNENNE
jgi:ABC-type glucose/galactose transport system permease subunit